VIEKLSARRHHPGKIQRGQPLVGIPGDRRISGERRRLRVDQWRLSRTTCNALPKDCRGEIGPVSRVVESRGRFREPALRRSRRVRARAGTPRRSTSKFWNDNLFTDVNPARFAVPPQASTRSRPSFLPGPCPGRSVPANDVVMELFGSMAAAWRSDRTASSNSPLFLSRNLAHQDVRPSRSRVQTRIDRLQQSFGVHPYFWIRE